MIRAEAIIVAIAGMFGALGVSAAAASAHIAEPGLETASAMLLAHAPALLGLAAARATAAAHGGALLASALVLTIGVTLFCGDLASRVYLGDRLFPMAAPVGGVGMILGWVCALIAGLLGSGGSRNGEA